ncbi:MAG TPA: adenylosuccinate synthetase [Pseudonocardiaceae bacterium]
MSAVGGHVVVVDLGYGDAGKGTVVDHLCARTDRPRPHAVVRFNGGAQAAHNVVTTDGRHHTFAQFGAGTFTPGVLTHLSRFTLVDPLALAAEAAHLAAVGVPDALDRLTVDGAALLTTPYHAAANRARAATLRHGTCGVGIGETMAYALARPDAAPRVADCRRPAVLHRRLTALRDHLVAELGPLDVPPVEACVDACLAFAGRVRVTHGPAYLRGLLDRGPVVFEGAQGVLLDEWHGFHPHTTWSTTTFANAETLLAECGHRAVRLGVVRAYGTRHGAGPFVTEDPGLDRPEPHNGTGRWQGAFRVGHLDLVALRHALGVCGGVDALAVTHLDRPAPLVCPAYELDGRTVTRLDPGADPADLAGRERFTRSLGRAVPRYRELDEDPARLLSAEAGAPVVLRSYGPTAADKVTEPVLTGDRHHVTRVSLEPALPLPGK